MFKKIYLIHFNLDHVCKIRYTKINIKLILIYCQYFILLYNHIFLFINFLKYLIIKSNTFILFYFFIIDKWLNNHEKWSTYYKIKPHQDLYTDNPQTEKKPHICREY